MAWDKEEKDRDDPLKFMEQFKKIIEGEEQKFKVELYLTAGQMIELGQFIKSVLHMKCPEGADHK